VKAKLRNGRSDPVTANEVWAMGFVHDQLYAVRRLRTLTMIDAYTRYVPAIVPRERFTTADVVSVLEQVCAHHGHPQSIRGERFNAHWFLNLADARAKCERWRGVCHTERPHGAIGYRTPSEARKASGLTKPARPEVRPSRAHGTSIRFDSGAEPENQYRIQVSFREPSWRELFSARRHAGLAFLTAPTRLTGPLTCPCFHPVKARDRR